MVNSARITIGVGGMILCAGLALAGPDAAPDARTQHVERLLQQHPGVALSERAGRIRRVWGRAFSGGATALESAEAFRQQHAGIFGVRPQDLVLAGAGQIQPVMYDRATGTYKFDLVRYDQYRNGVPVFRGMLKLLARRERGSPVVLASADLHGLDGFTVDRRAAEAPAAPGVLQAAMDRVQAISE